MMWMESVWAWEHLEEQMAGAAAGLAAMDGTFLS